MIAFLEATALLLPVEAGGRLDPIAPRQGSYRPFAGSMRVRFIEGPPMIEPGGCGRVVVEVEEGFEDVVPGSELHLIEEDRIVGLLTVTRGLK
ncbi:MAG TPA: hypothetical protein VJ853_05950 [Thermoanaerobaculia bacterium]|nr:hypothetical protein [Thermoanaerobaculia bacterium]